MKLRILQPLKNSSLSLILFLAFLAGITTMVVGQTSHILQDPGAGNKDINNRIATIQTDIRPAAIVPVNGPTTTKTSTGTTWSTASNWSPSGVPASTDDVIINTAMVVSTAAGGTCASLTINSGKSLTINSTRALTVGTDGVTNNGTITLTDGTTTTTTYLYIAGNLTNNTGATITGTGTYTSIYFNGTTAQTFTNSATVTAPVNNLILGNNAGLTMLGSQVVVGRINLYYGTLTNSNKITLGNGGTTTATVQIGANTSNAAGSFDQAPTFNAGTGGIQLVYAPALNDYSTSYEVPPDGIVAYLQVVNTPRTLALSRDITIPYIYTTGLSLSSGTLSIGAHTLTVNGVIGTVSGTLTGGTSSNITFSGTPQCTLPAVSGGLNNLTINDDAGVTLGGAVTVNGTLALTSGVLINSSYLTMASGSTISRSAGTLITAPAFSGTMNLTYTGSSAITAGMELPSGSSVINNMTSNAGGVTQYAYTSSTSNLLTDAFPNLTSWTGNIGSAMGQFNSIASSNAGGTAPEVEFIGSTLHGTSSTTYYIYSGPINTTGYSAVNVSFKIMSTGNWTQNFPSYLKLQSSTSTSGPWHDVWSVPYTAYSAQTVSVPFYSTDVGGNMYFQFAFVGDFYALDYWFFDNLVVDGVMNTPITSTATVNGTFDITAGTYAIGGNNTLVLNGGISGSSAVIGGATCNLSVGGSGTNLMLPSITGGLNNLTITRANGVSLGATQSLTVNGTLSNSSGNGGLIIKSDATGTGSLISSTASVPATVERYLTKYGVVYDKMYHFLSSPVSGQAISPQFSDPPSNSTNDFYKLDEHTYEWINFRNTAGNAINPSFGESNFVIGRGYMVAYNADVTKTFTGNLTTGTLTTGSELPALTYTSSQGLSAGWNLIGNPYSSAIDWDNVTPGQYANIDNAVYCYDNASQTYKTWVGGTGSLTDGIIPEMQGFLVKANAASPTLYLENQDRVHGGSGYYKVLPAIDNLLTLKVEGNNHYDETYVRFLEGATADFNSAWDAYKLMGGSSVPNLYTTVNSIDYAINTLPLSSKDVPLPLNLKVGAQTSYTITANSLNTFAPNSVITLKDLQTSYTQNLMTNPVYQFTAGPNDNSGRFMLYFSGSIGINDQGNLGGVTVSSHGNTIFITGLDPHGSAEIFVYDLLGRETFHRTVLHTNHSDIDMSGHTGCFIVKTVSDAGTNSSKVILN